MVARYHIFDEPDGLQHSSVVTKLCGAQLCLTFAGLSADICKSPLSFLPPLPLHYRYHPLPLTTSKTLSRSSPKDSLCARYLDTHDKMMRSAPSDFDYLTVRSVVCGCGEQEW